MEIEQEVVWGGKELRKGRERMKGRGGKEEQQGGVLTRKHPFHSPPPLR